MRPSGLHPVTAFRLSALLMAGMLALASFHPAYACSQKWDDVRKCSGPTCDSADVSPPSLDDAIAAGHLRLATFNIRVFSKGSRNQHKIARIANVLRQFDIVAIQELRDEVVLKKTVQVLETDTAADWEYLISGPVGNGVKERYAFLYRTDRVSAAGTGTLISNTWRDTDPPPQPDADTDKVTQRQQSMRQDGKKPFIRQPFAGSFKAGLFSFRLLTIHTLYDKPESIERGVEFRQLAAIYKELLNDGGDRDLLVLGDFNDPPDHWRFAPLRAAGDMHCLTRPPQKTTIRDVSLYDTICYQQPDTGPNYAGGEGVAADVIVFEDQPPYSTIPTSDGRYKRACLEVSDHRPIHALFHMNVPDAD